MEELNQFKQQQIVSVPELNMRHFMVQDFVFVFPVILFRHNDKVAETHG